MGRQGNPDSGALGEIYLFAATTKTSTALYTCITHFLPIVMLLVGWDFSYAVKVRCGSNTGDNPRDPTSVVAIPRACGGVKCKQRGGPMSTAPGKVSYKTAKRCLEVPQTSGTRPSS